jgi:hypothetical protein
MFEKDTDAPIDIKEFLGGCGDHNNQEKEISYIDANVSIIDHDFTVDGKNKDDIILCISNLDIKDLDSETTQSESKLVKKIAIPYDKSKERKFEVNKTTVTPPKRNYKKIIFSFIIMITLLIIGIMVFFVTIK